MDEGRKESTCDWTQKPEIPINAPDAIISPHGMSLLEPPDAYMRRDRCRCRGFPGRLNDPLSYAVMGSLA